jgi:hypothetical protein
VTLRRGGAATYGAMKGAPMHRIWLYLLSLLSSIAPDSVGTLDPDG